MSRISASAVERSTSAALAIAAMTMLIAGDALAQKASGGVFLALANVDESAGNVGSIGCGGGSGVDLSAALGNSTNEGGLDDQDRPIGQRRGLFRLCDVQTPNGANGWTSDASDETGRGVSQRQISQQATLLSPEEVFAGMDGSSASFDVQVGNIARRLSMVRLARMDSNPGTVTLAQRSSMGIAPSFFASGENLSGSIFESEKSPLMMALEEGLSGGNADEGGLGFFLNGRVLAIDGKQNDAERGSYSVGGGFTLGLDKRVGDSGYAGVAFGYTRVDSSYDNTGSDAGLDAYTFSLYGALYPTDQVYIDGTVTGSILVYDTENDIAIADSGPPVEAIDGDTDGGSFGANFGVGIDLPFRGTSVSPYVRMSVLHTVLNDFSQRGGDGSLDINLDKQEATSLTTDLGFQVGYALSTRLGVVTPYLRAAWVHEYLDENDDVKGDLDAIAGAEFRLKPEGTDENYANFGGGVSATLSGGLSQFIDYDVIALHDNVVVHQVTAGIRLEL